MAKASATLLSASTRPAGSLPLKPLVPSPVPRVVSPVRFQQLDRSGSHVSAMEVNQHAEARRLLPQVVRAPFFQVDALNGDELGLPGTTDQLFPPVAAFTPSMRGVPDLPGSRGSPPGTRALPR